MMPEGPMRRADRAPKPGLGEKAVDRFAELNQKVVEQGRELELRKRLEQELVREIQERRRAENALREADRRKDEFLAMLAHELRNPLAVIRGGLDLLALAAVEQDTVSSVRRQAEHLTRIVNDLLDVSRVTRGKVRLHRETCDLRDVIQSAVEIARPRIDSAGHTLTVALPEVPLIVEADCVRLAQIFASLLGNAVKFTPHGGCIHVTLRPEGGHAVIAVRDNGIGINGELLPRVFDLFVQGPQSLERSQGGLGIGLTLVRNLVELHGGNVTAHSDGEGRGSEFVVRLPTCARKDCLPSRLESAVSVQPLAILVVDDNVGATTLLARLLEKLGPHDVRVAHDGLAALEVAASWEPDLILMDIGMPRMDGYEVARRLRSQRQFDGVRLVALTGYGSEEDQRSSAAAGFDLHVVKPPSLDMLRQVLSGTQARRPPAAEKPPASFTPTCKVG